MAWVRAEDAKTAAVLEQDARYAGLFSRSLEDRRGQGQDPRPAFDRWSGSQPLAGRRPRARNLAADEPRRLSKVRTRVDDRPGPGCPGEGREGQLVLERRRLRGAGGASLHDLLVGWRRGCGYAARVRFALGAIRRRRFLAAPRQAGCGVGRPTIRSWSPGNGRPASSLAPAIRSSSSASSEGSRCRRPSRCFAERPATSGQSIGLQRRHRPRRRSSSVARSRSSRPNTTSSARTARAKLALPLEGDIVALVGGRLVVSLREDWTTGRSDIPAGIAGVDRPRRRSAAPERLRPTLIYAPGPREAFAQATATRGHLLVTVLDNVKGRAYVYTPEPGGKWSRRQLELPDKVSVTSSTRTCTATAPS